MSTSDKGIIKRRQKGVNNSNKVFYAMPIAQKLILSFMIVSITTNLFFTAAGIRLIGDRIVTEAQERVRTDLNAAREIYLGELRHIYDVIRITARRPILQDILLSENIEQNLNDLIQTREIEGLDILTLTDKDGKVVLRTNAPYYIGDNQFQDEVVSMVLRDKAPIETTEIVSVENLQYESNLLVERAYFQFINTPMARYRDKTEETAGMILKAAAPVFDTQRNLIGVLYGGILLNKSYQIVDIIKQTVFQDVKYEGKDVGTATIFQDDVRISTNVLNSDGSRAIGTRVAENVYNQVVVKGEPWTGRAYVVNNWYITAYEPIKNISNVVIGILYVGILEQRYVDIKNRAILIFIVISAIGILFSIFLSYFLSRSISVPAKKLVQASKELAGGNLEVKVVRVSRDEIGELADSFNAMATALKDRDQKLKEFTRKKVMESERLALIGQLSANVAHELNNPLQGIVTYSHLVLEKISNDDTTRQNIQKIVIQANRCRDIIRGLLDFSRQRKPDKILSNVNYILHDCISLLEKQALFHNIKIILNLDDNLPKVILDPSQIERVFINLIVNAAEAMNGDGQLSISTRTSSSGQEIEICFIDTGTGISDENLEKIFDPFFTTKETGHGVGLGLAICYGIIKEHRGVILVESQLGKGTNFTVKLPIASSKAGGENGS